MTRLPGLDAADRALLGQLALGAALGAAGLLGLGGVLGLTVRAFLWASGLGGCG